MDPAGLSAADHATAVRAGRLTARAGVESPLARMAERDGPLRAITDTYADEALAAADALDAGGPGHDGPLAGVPVLVKDEFDVAGHVTTLGGRGNSTPAATDCAMVRRVRAAGGIIVGRTAMPEFGQFPFTDSIAHGSTHNPWDLARTPGGSSGGSAAAVASGMVPVALGGDGGGSIRIPASCCGLVGLKPTRGRVSLAPYAEEWFALVVAGGLTRTVGDTALLLDAIAGPDPVDRWPLPAPSRSFAEEAAADPGRMRIGWTTRSVVPWVSTDPQVAAATVEVAAAFDRIGHDVRRWTGRFPTPTDAFLPQFYAGMRVAVGQVEHPDLLESRSRQTARMSGWATPGVVERAIRRGERVADALDRRALTDHDVLILPTMPLLPPQTGFLDGLDTVRAQLRSMPYVANTALTNVSGHPTLSVPGGRSREGWPIGVSLIARRGAEGLLLAVAAQLERERPWPGLAPAYT